MNERMTAKLIQKHEKHKMRNSKPRSNFSNFQGFPIGVKIVNNTMFLKSRHTFLRDTGCQSKKVITRTVRHPETMSDEDMQMDLDMFSLKKRRQDSSFQIFAAVGHGLKLSSGIRNQKKKKKIVFSVDPEARNKAGR